MNDQFENHKYNPAFISRFVQGKLSDKDLDEFSAHYMECELCTNEMHEQIDFLGYAEKADLKGIILEMSQTPQMSELTIEKDLGDFSILRNLSKDFLNEYYPDERIEYLEKYWDIVENEYDLEKSQFKYENIFIKNTAEIEGIGFTDFKKNRSTEKSIITIIIIIEIAIEHKKGQSEFNNIISALINKHAQENIYKEIIEKLRGFFNARLS